MLLSGYREETGWTRFYVKRSPYIVSDEDVRIFEDEITKYSETLEEPLQNIRVRFFAVTREFQAALNIQFTLTSTNKIMERVFGTFIFTFGTEFQFPIRSLVRSPAEFREHIAEIVRG